MLPAKSVNSFNMNIDDPNVTNQPRFTNNAFANDYGKYFFFCEY